MPNCRQVGISGLTQLICCFYLGGSPIFKSALTALHDHCLKQSLPPILIQKFQGLDDVSAQAVASRQRAVTIHHQMRTSLCTSAIRSFSSPGAIGILAGTNDVCAFCVTKNLLSGCRFPLSYTSRIFIVQGCSSSKDVRILLERARLAGVMSRRSRRMCKQKLDCLLFKGCESLKD